MVCSLTDEPPSFEGACPYFQIDPLIDFQTRMREEQVKKSTYSSKRGLRFALIGFPLLVALVYGLYLSAEHYKNKLVLEEAERWSLAIQAELEDHDESIFDEIDLYQLMLRATHDGEVSAYATLNNTFSRSVKARILFPFEQMGSSLSIKQLSIRVEDQRAFILFRVSGSSGAFNYIEIEMKRVDGRLKIVDGYNFGTGDFFNDIAQSMTPDQSGNFRGRLSSFEQLTASSRLIDISNQLCAYRINNAVNSYNELNNKVKEEKFALFCLLPLFYEINPNHATAEHEKLIRLDAGAQFQAFHAVLKHYYKPNLDEFRAARKQLERIIGPDNYLDLLELDLALAANEPGVCEKIEELRKDFLFDTRAYALQLKCAEQSRQTEKVLSVLQAMKERLDKKGLVFDMTSFVQVHCPNLLSNTRVMEALRPVWNPYDSYSRY